MSQDPATLNDASLPGPAQAQILALGTDTSAKLAFDPVQIVTLLGALAGAIATAATGGGAILVAGMSIAQLTALAAGVAAQIPSAVEAFEEIKALVDGGTAPTPEQWAKWNAAADDATAAARAAEDAVISGAAPPAQPAG